MASDVPRGVSVLVQTEATDEVGQARHRRDALIEGARVVGAKNRHGVWLRCRARRGGDLINELCNALLDLPQQLPVPDVRRPVARQMADHQRALPLADDPGAHALVWQEVGDPH
eukprot:7384423-Prymnesium_polylepis.1